MLSPSSTPADVAHALTSHGYLPDDGLATAIFTQDIGRANRVAQRIHVGLTWINCWFLRDLRTSFGGSKASGIGREGGVHSFEFYTDLRNVMVKF